MRMEKKRRILGWLLTICLLFAQIPLTVSAAESAVSEVMRLAATEGAVAVTTQNGKDIKVISDMKLYSGYHIATEEDGYAYISLDSTKVLKLDSSSEAEIRKSGKKLEIMLVSGDLFFNVKKPLEEDESMNIRTSTMVTGIRGTSGIVSTTGADMSSLMLLDGEVTVQGVNPSNGQTVHMVVNAGQKVTVKTGITEGNNQVDISSERVLESEIPSFAGIEVAKDPQLQQRIQQETTLNVPQIVSEYEETVQKAEAAQPESNASETKSGNNAGTEEPVIPGGNDGPEEPTDTEDPSNPENPINPEDPVNPGGNDDPVVEPGSSTTIPSNELAAGSIAETLNQAFLQNSKVMIDGDRLNIVEDIIVPENRTLEISAEVINDAALTVEGSLKIKRYFENNSDIHVGENATVTIDDDTIIFENNGNIVNDGEFLNSGIFQSELADGSAVSAAASFVNRGKLVNHGLFQTTVIEIKSGAVTETGNFSNEGQIENYGQFQIGSPTNFEAGDPSQWSCEEGILYRSAKEDDFPEEIKELSRDIMGDSAIFVRVANVTPTGERIYAAGGDLQWMIKKFDNESMYLEGDVVIYDQNITIPSGGNINFYMDGYTMTMDGGKFINNGSLGFKSCDWNDQRGNADGLYEGRLKGINMNCLIDNRKKLTLSEMNISLESSGSDGGKSYAIKNSSGAKIVPVSLTKKTDSPYYQKANLTVENRAENGWALYNSGGAVSCRENDTETTLSLKSATEGYTVNTDDTSLSAETEDADGGYIREIIFNGRKEWSPSKAAAVNRLRMIASPAEAAQADKENKKDEKNEKNESLPIATSGNAAKVENTGDTSDRDSGTGKQTEGLKGMSSTGIAVWKEDGDNEFTSPAHRRD